MPKIKYLLTLPMIFLFQEIEIKCLFCKDNLTRIAIFLVQYYTLWAIT